MTPGKNPTKRQRLLRRSGTKPMTQCCAVHQNPTAAKAIHERPVRVSNPGQDVSLLGHFFHYRVDGPENCQAPYRGPQRERMREQDEAARIHTGSVEKLLPDISAEEEPRGE